MGTDPYQPLTLISDFEESKFYAVSLNLEGLRVLTVKPAVSAMRFLCLITARTFRQALMRSLYVRKRENTMRSGMY